MTCAAFPLVWEAAHHQFLGTYIIPARGFVLWIGLSSIKVNYSLGTTDNSEPSFFLRKLSNPHSYSVSLNTDPPHTHAHKYVNIQITPRPHHVYELQPNSSFLKRELFLNIALGLSSFFFFPLLAVSVSPPHTPPFFVAQMGPLCTSGWPWVHGYLCATASQAQGLEARTTSVTPITES